MNIIQKARKLQRMCGTYAVARMLARAGVPFFIAHYALVVQKGGN